MGSSGSTDAFNRLEHLVGRKGCDTSEVVGRKEGLVRLVSGRGWMT